MSLWFSANVRRVVGRNSTGPHHSVADAESAVHGIEWSNVPKRQHEDQNSCRDHSNEIWQKSHHLRWNGKGADVFIIHGKGSVRSDTSRCRATCLPVSSSVKTGSTVSSIDTRPLHCGVQQGRRLLGQRDLTKHVCVMSFIYWNVTSQNEVLMRTEVMHIVADKWFNGSCKWSTEGTPNGLDHISRESHS